LDGYGRGGLKALADISALPALQAALPTLTDKYAHAEDQLLIIQLQNKDVVAQLCTLLADPNFPSRDDVLHWLQELRDDGAVPALTEAMCHDKEDYIRVWSIRVLATTRTKSAVAALVKGLEADYSGVNGFKVMPDHDFNAQFRGQIADALKDITKQDFGTDAAQWRKWLDTHSVD
jgi:HEAT repeat protein